MSSTTTGAPALPTRAAGGRGRTQETMRRSARLEGRYEALLDEHGAALRRVAATYELDPQLREDLFQEICLAVWMALPRFRGESSWRTFLFRIAHNRGLSHGWREGRSPAHLEEPERLIDPAPSAEDEMASRQRKSRLVAALHLLPVLSRQILTLRLEGIPFREIAEITGLSENAVTVRASRARTRLRTLLDARGKES